MAYINVDEVYILDNTGLQVDMATDIPFVDAGFTDAQKEQARKNIAAGGTNPNLLDNPFFQVNQRSFTSGDFGTGSNGFTVDRWRCHRSIITVNADGSITFKPNLNSFGLNQAIETRKMEQGRTYTLSANIGGVIYSWSFEWTGQATYSPYIYNSARFYIQTGSAFDMYLVTNSEEITVYSMKLELGSVSTLANDTPPDYGTELAKCQRYFVRLKYTDTGKQVGFGYMYNTTQARILIPTPVTMRVAPTVTTTNLGGAFRVNAGGTYLTPSSASATTTALPNGVNINFGTSSAGTSGAIATVFSYGEGSIDLSADL